MSPRAHRTTGLTLIEMTLVMATIAVLMGLAVPAARSLMRSFQTQGSVTSMIDAALSSARAMAMSTQNYVGVRFQKLCVSSDPADPAKNILNAPQYMVFIAHEDPKKTGGLTNGFRAVDGLEPVKLPDTMGVMDLTGITSDAAVKDLSKDVSQLSDATTFSVIFSPAGKLIVHKVRVRNRNGVYQPRNDAGSNQASSDDVFNSADNICKYRRGMFLQDDYSPLKNSATDKSELGLGEEDSRTSFVIYESPALQAAYNTRGAAGGSPQAWSVYLSKLDPWYVSPYAGNLIASH